jgi:asparagine synthase (glutamine-hydrolysing)
MFAFAIWDVKKKELFLARDQLGKKPLKYFHNKDFFLFGSELKSLLKDPHVPREIDRAAIDHFLTYQYVPSPLTGFKHIYKLEPAHYAIISRSGKIKTTKYWKPQFYPKLDLSPMEFQESLLSQLKQSVKLRLRSDVPLGAHLSGGVDSSLIVALAAQEMNTPLKTFSVGFSEREYDELHFARLVAERYKTDHHEIRIGPEVIRELPQMVYHYEEPFADPSLLPTWKLCGVTKKEVTVVLNGDGGDENFAGYLRYQAFMAYRLLRHLPFRGQAEAAASFLSRTTHFPPFRHAATLLNHMGRLKGEAELYAKLVGSMDIHEKRQIYTDEFQNEINKNNTYDYLQKRLENAYLSPLERLLFTDMETYLGEDILTKVDIAGMAHSLEIRSPFLDQEFMAYAARVPDRYKLRGMKIYS